MAPTMYEQLGGESKVRAIIEIFIDRVVNDVMIGFFFRKTFLPRLKELEYQHAAAFLGAAVTYRGKPLRQAHGPHRIQGGQFARRKQILKEVLSEQQVPQAIAQAWLAHQESLRSEITTAADDGCDMPGQ